MSETINKNPELNVNISKFIIDGIREQIHEEIKESLLKGESYYIKGVGKLVPYKRNVKLKNGDSGFAVILKVKQDKDFKKLIRENF